MKNEIIKMENKGEKVEITVEEAIKDCNQGEIELYTESDRGELKIRVNGEIDYIRNGYGDGMMYAQFVNQNTELPKHAYFVKHVSAEELLVYSYDCGNTVEYATSGEFDIYTAPYYDCGRVILVRKQSDERNR